MQDLRDAGVTVIELLPERVRAQMAMDMKESIRNAPELVRPFDLSEHALVQLGGCGFLGLASTFWQPFIRKLRGLAFRTLAPMVSDGRNVEMFLDRVCARLEGQSPDGETMHRDLSNCLPLDIIYGGWINLGDSDQFFSGAPGTHMEQGTGDGFARIPKAEFHRYADRMTQILIPPGCMLVFNQNLVHEVNKIPADDGYFRLHVGIRVTDSITPMIDNSAAIRDMGVPTIKSGQVPRLYAKLHNACFQDKTFDVVKAKKRKGIVSVPMVGGLRGFSKRFKPEMISPTGIVRAVCPSLRELGCMLEPLSTGEVDLASGTPKRNWNSVWNLSEYGVWTETSFAL